MHIEFHFPNKNESNFTWKPSKPPILPKKISSDFSEQIIAETAGGKVFVQDKGLRSRSWELKFERINLEDHDLAYDFFLKVRKSFLKFEYQDFDGVLHTVRWMNAFDFSQDVMGRFTGTIMIREESLDYA